MVCLAPSVSLAGAIHDAAKEGDVRAISAALAAGADVNESDGSTTALYAAVRRGHLAAAKLLIERGADVNAETKSGPALIAAVKKSRIELIDLLLGNGADPDAAFDGRTAIHFATELSCFPCVEALVAAGADVNAQTRDGETPLHFARRLGTREMADFLVAHGVVLPKPPPISDKLATADVAKGRIVFARECVSCHFVEAAKGRSAGPLLWGIVGRDKASVADFAYSEAIRALEGVWTYEDLNTFLSGPRATAPGVAMYTPGVRNEPDRVNLIAYLRTLSDSPIPLP
jgi:cytochrome c